MGESGYARDVAAGVVLAIRPRCEALAGWIRPPLGMREVATGADALRLAVDVDVDCVILGVPLPDVDASALLDELCARGLGVVVLVERAHPEVALELVRAGAIDVLARSALEPRSLDAALRRATERTHTGREAALSQRVWERMPLGVAVLEVAQGAGLRLVAVNEAGRALAVQGEGRIVGVEPHVLREVCGRVLLSGEPARLDSILVSLDGRDCTYDGHVTRLDARRVLVLLEDVTELLVVRRQLEAASRMEAIGRLAGGVAHDFNNMLTVISGHAGFVRDATAPGDSCHEDALSILDAAGRSADLTRQLLAFGRRQMSAPRLLELNATLSSMQSLLRRIIGEHIALSTQLDSRAGSIVVDPTQVEQILMNLAVNARDAMPGGGTLRVETHRRTVVERLRPGSFVVEPGEYAELRVIDDGEGMTDAVLARMFEPFFTTKSKDDGTGLGLATVYGIVKQSGGSVWAESEVGRGTTFYVLFPRVDGVPTELPPPPLRPSMPGGETVLFVEDERLVRRAVRRILETAGYRVLEAEAPSVALDLAVAEHVDLVLTDVVMPEMNGRELARRLGEALPDARILFTSGYAADEAVGSAHLLDPGVPFIPKPFTRQALLEAVHDALRSGPNLASLESASP